MKILSKFHAFHVKDVSEKYSNSRLLQLQIFPDEFITVQNMHFIDYHMKKISLD